MKYTIYDNEEAIATFKSEADAVNFLQLKRDQRYKEMFPSILDDIAEKTGLDRSKTGAWPLDATSIYLQKAKAEIEASILIKEM